MGDAKRKATVEVAVEPNKDKYEKNDNGHENNEEGNPLDTKILNIRYKDKPNLVTDTSYVLSDSAVILSSFHLNIL